MEITGKIIVACEPRGGVSQRTGNNWKMQEFVIQTREAYPRTCLFSVFGADRLEQFNLHQGDTVHVWLDINARAWQDRYFNDIRAFRVDHIDPNAVNTGAQPTQAASTLGSAPAAAAPQQDPFAAGAGSDASNDLPF